MTILLNRSFVRTISSTVETGYCLNVVPFRWDKKAALLSLPGRDFRVFGGRWKRWAKLRWALGPTPGWNTVKYVYLLYELFLVSGFVRLGLAHTTKFRPYSTQALTCAAVSIVVGIQICLMTVKVRFVGFINQCLTFYKNTDDKFSKPNAPAPTWHRKCELILRIAQLGVGPTVSLTTGVIFLRHPEWYIFPTSIFPPHIHTGWMTYLTTLPMVLFVYATWTCVFIILQQMLIFTYGVIFLLRELRPDRSNSAYTSHAFRDSQNVILTFRTLTLLFNRLNELGRDYASVFMNNTVICLTLICIFTLLRFHDRLRTESTVAAVICAFLGSAYLLLTYIKMGEINSLAIKLIRSWELRLSLGRRDKLLLSKYFKSCRPLRVELGNFGYYRKPASIRIFGNLFVYTARFMLMTKRFF